LSNLKFALAVEPHNSVLQDYKSTCDKLRAQGLPTLPAVLGTELQINPFLRTRHGTVIDAVLQFAPHTSLQEAEIFGQLRLWKNEFK
jgi:hydroxyacylglutathione hydrolase